jgi:hypothetical protein
MSRFGKPPRPKRFSPPTATRGGGYGFFAKEVEEPLTGEVHGLKAAKGEERFARVLNKAIKKGSVRSYFFRSSPGLEKGQPGWKELDFEIETTSGTVAVSVEGADFVHKGESKRNQDKINEMLIMARLAKMGRPVPRIERVFDYELTTQADAEKVVKRLGIR